MYYVSVSTPPSQGNNYQWYKNNELIPGATNNFYQIDQVSENESGDYYVKISNKYRSIRSTVSNLSVQPLFHELNIIKGDNGSITVSPNDVRLRHKKSVIFEAIPSNGYVFDEWSDGYKDNPRLIIPTKNIQIEAYFTLSESLEEVVAKNGTFQINKNTPYFLDGDNNFLQDAVIVDNALALNIVTSLKNSDIYYTLDGTAPSFLSDEFTGTINLKNTIVLTAVCYNDDYTEKYASNK